MICSTHFIVTKNQITVWSKPQRQSRKIGRNSSCRWRRTIVAIATSKCKIVFGIKEMQFHVTILFCCAKIATNEREKICLPKYFRCNDTKRKTNISRLYIIFYKRIKILSNTCRNNILFLPLQSNDDVEGPQAPLFHKIPQRIIVFYIINKHII